MMERTNRREQIISEAARLFMDQGYHATSVRQIAEAVGVTEAALYYHFKDGKRALLQAVVECELPDLVDALEQVGGADSLSSMVRIFLQSMAQRAGTHRADKLRWIMSEFPKLNADERELFYTKHELFQSTLREIAARFVEPSAADMIAWTLSFITFGYGQMMIGLGMRDVMAFDQEQFVEHMVAMVCCLERDQPGTSQEE